MRILYPGRIGIWRCWCRVGRVTWEPEEKPSEQGENQQQTQPTYGTEPESNPGHIGRRRAPLHHPSFPLVKVSPEYLENLFLLRSRSLLRYNQPEMK